VQDAAEVAPGVFRVHTAGHGGFWLHPDHAATLPDDFEGSRECHEEDCHAAMVAWYLGTVADFKLPDLGMLQYACHRMARTLADSAERMNGHGWNTAAVSMRQTVANWERFLRVRICPECGNRRARSGVCHHRDCGRDVGASPCVGCAEVGDWTDARGVNLCPTCEMMGVRAGYLEATR